MYFTTKTKKYKKYKLIKNPAGIKTKHKQIRSAKKKHVSRFYKHCVSGKAYRYRHIGVAQPANLTALTQKSSIVLKGDFNRIELTGYRVNPYTEPGYGSGMDNVRGGYLRSNNRSVRQNYAFGG